MTEPYPSVPPTPPRATRSVPWSAGEAVATLLLAFGFGILLTVPLLVVGTAMGAEGRQVNIFALPLTPLVLGATTLLVVASRHRGGVRQLLGPSRPSAADWAVGVGVALAGYLGLNLALGGVLQLLAELAGYEPPVTQPTFREAAADPATAWVLVVSAVLLAPVAEELLYRGMLFQALRDRFGVGWGVWVSGALFGVTHVDLGGTWLSNAMLLGVIWPLGALLAWVFHRRGSLVVPIVAHAVFNAINVTFMITLQNAV